ncbi:MAG: CBS domain-containing protein [Rhodospirillales bacterium]
MHAAFPIGLMTESSNVPEKVSLKNTVHAILRDVHDIVHIDHAVSEATVRMEGGNRHVYVVDGDELVGIITKRDIRKRREEKGVDPHEITISETMTPRIAYCRMNDPVKRAINLMKENDTNQLAVLNDANELIGEVFLTDIVERVDIQDLDSKTLHWVKDELKRTKPQGGATTSSRSLPPSKGRPPAYAIRPKLRPKNSAP